jgi:hypothetical protein
VIIVNLTDKLRGTMYGTALCDVAMTLYNVTYFGPGTEANPVIKSLSEQMGDEAGIVLPKLVALSCVEYVSSKLPEQRNKLYGLAAGIWGVGAIANAIYPYLQ